jgi:hypothetical protein
MKTNEPSSTDPSRPRASRGRVHAPSLLLGACLVAGTLALSAAAPAPTQESEVETTGVGAGLWRDLVRIEEGSPYTVPEGMVLVLQGCGFVTREDTDPILIGEPLTLLIDGVRRLILVPTAANHDIQPGWAVPAKSQVTVVYGNDPQIGYMFGYLVQD